MAGEGEGGKGQRGLERDWIGGFHCQIVRLLWSDVCTVCYVVTQITLFSSSSSSYHPLPRYIHVL